MNLSQLKQLAVKPVKPVPAGWHTVREIAQHSGVNISSVNRWLTDSPKKPPMRRFAIRTLAGARLVPHYQIKLDA